LEAESRKVATLDFSLERSSSRRYIMWPALVGFVVNIFLDVGGKAEVLGGVFGFGEWRGQVVKTVFRLRPEAWCW